MVLYRHGLKHARELLDTVMTFLYLSLVTLSLALQLGKHFSNWQVMLDQPLELMICLECRDCFQQLFLTALHDMHKNYQSIMVRLKTFSGSGNSGALAVAASFACLAFSICPNRSFSLQVISSLSSNGAVPSLFKIYVVSSGHLARSANGRQLATCCLKSSVS